MHPRPADYDFSVKMMKGFGLLFLQLFFPPDECANRFPAFARGQVAIIDAEADIRDLDVGDIDDPTTDLPASVKQEILKLKQQSEFVANKKNRADPVDMVSQIPTGKQTMCFAVLNLEYAIEQDRKTGRGSHDLAQQWQGLLETGGTEARFYAVDPDRILIVTSTNRDLETVQKFVLSYPDIVDFFEVNQKKVFPNNRYKELVDDEERKRVGEKLKWGGRYIPDREQRPRVVKPVEDGASEDKGKKSPSDGGTRKEGRKATAKKKPGEKRRSKKKTKVREVAKKPPVDVTVLEDDDDDDL
ncbi:unnamed protein product [Amoebophrya sp. A120]|nr:unnamed protein product [Amoebophrya sp. A120]|eukprot:GSA120T00007944001.1